MLKKKDYIKFFDELYIIELQMKGEVDALLKVITEEADVVVLKRIRADEIRHGKIVKGMITLIKQDYAKR